MRRSLSRVLVAGLVLTACTPLPTGGDDRAASGAVLADEAAVPRRAPDDTGGPDQVGGARPSPRSSPEPAFADAAIILRDDGGFSQTVLAEVAALDGVVRVGGSRNDEVALWASTAADGTPLDGFTDGFKVLVTARVDEAGLPGPRLARGEVLLTPVGAALRGGLDVGGTVTLGRDRSSLRVAAVGEDQEPYGSAELVLHPADADAVGLEPLDRLFLQLQEGTDVEAVAGRARQLLGTDEPRAVEVRELRPGRGRRTLPISAAKQRFGEFAFRDRSGTRDIDQEQAWIDANIVTETVPLLGDVRCHRLVLDDLRAALDDIVAAGLEDWADPARFGGCWYPRRISEQGNLSKHAWGIALDVNVDFSVPGGGEVPPDEVVEAFRDNGFSWGGDFPTPDNHHFEWVGDSA